MNGLGESGMRICFGVPGIKTLAMESVGRDLFVPSSSASCYTSAEYVCGLEGGQLLCEYVFMKAPSLEGFVTQV